MHDTDGQETHIKDKDNNISPITHCETIEDTTEQAAKSGHAATDEYGAPVIQFDLAAEARLRLKIDLYIVPTVAVLYLFCFIDRANIGNARLAGFEKDLNLHGYDYNQVLSVFYVSYIVLEIPATMACKLLGPGWFLPATSLGFGVMTVAFAFVRNMHSACAIRFLLGLFEAGMLPGIAYYLSRWYRRSELAFRLSLYIVMAPLAGAFGGLLASAILKLDNFGSTKRWEMIFAIEGVISIGLSLISFFTLTDRPETASWLTQAEKDLAVARVKSEMIGTTEVLDKFNKAKVIRGILNPVTIATAWVFLLGCVTVQGFGFFAPTVVRTIYPHASVVKQQLYTVPPYVVGAFFVVAVNFASWKLDRRNILMLMSMPLVMAGYIMFLASKKASVRYGATFFITAGAFNSGALTSAQVAANVVSDTARSSGIGFSVMMGNIGGLIATWAFLPFDGPNYPIGNGLNLATSAAASVILIILQIWMKMDNKQRQNRDVRAELADMNLEQIQNLEWHHPGFRWRP